LFMELAVKNFKFGVAVGAVYLERWFDVSGHII